MSNFKSGSGNLTFGDDNDSTDETTSEMETESESNRSTSPERSAEESSEQAVSEGKDSEQSISSARESTMKNEYPYFIRRRNVGDERDVRLEIFLRDKVADRESQFRNELAKCLGTNEVSKTDAREFALLSAFQNPENVAELMEEEGFGTFD